MPLGQALSFFFFLALECFEWREIGFPIFVCVLRCVAASLRSPVVCKGLTFSVFAAGTKSVHVYEESYRWPPSLPPSATLLM